ncbi:MAG TPA: sugar ABC transporter permease [Clostridiales bacterium]|nr:sugar ABC transporter permease [Clostridiales bacterium]
MNTATVTERRRQKGRFARRYFRYLPLYLMMVPGMIYLLVNNYIPMTGIIIAFKQVNFRIGILKSPFIGLKNFEFLFRGDAWLITRNTIGYNLVFIIITPIIAISIAILLNELTKKGLKQFYQTVILVPYLISIVVVSYLVYALLSTENGFLNNTILPLFGIKEKIGWYSSPQYWPFILVLTQVWKGFGYSTIIYFATVVGIDQSYYEAASIDGATRWEKVKHVTLPCLKSTVITLTLLSIGRMFYSDFGLFYQVPMNSGPLLDVTNTIDTYVYRGLMQNNNIGMSSAAGVFQSVVGFILVLTANAIVNKVSREDALF